MSECTHERTNPNGCLNCPAVFCWVCTKHHRGYPKRCGESDGLGFWDHPNPGPCLARLKAELVALRCVAEAARAVADAWSRDGRPHDAMERIVDLHDVLSTLPKEVA